MVLLTVVGFVKIYKLYKVVLNSESVDEVLTTE